MTQRIILDTNAVSELMQQELNPDFEAWYSKVPRRLIFTTAITLSEMMFGVCKLPEGKHKRFLHQQARTIMDEFVKRTYDFNAMAAIEYGDIFAQRKRMGRPTDVQDAQIAAIARANDCIVATRNVKDFEDVGVPLINPWEHDVAV